VARLLGLARVGQQHSALEDAWLAMRVYLSLFGCPHSFSFDALQTLEPTNLRAAPPMPDGPLPRRKRVSRSADRP
jgi:DNA polymerase-3 subunit epsilon